uniref:NADH-ubiquinone oxidoreductase chain 2 n=1 Tax=Goniada japonica TaxID=1644143 RepID=A0A0F6T561_9ANNE|nr:NADH dehydrogenase subunit 2 [Goniada japonica]AKE32093.1 NADH dehydrogenase subunit 2 [Goniada japonica]
MIIMPYYFLFLSTLFMGSIMSISANHWIFVWMGLEINLLSFIPIMFSSMSNQETEASVKYFMTQALGSSFILLSAFSITSMNLHLISPNMWTTMLFMGLMIKMGAAPFHFWLPQVMMSLSWYSCMILTTWQKLAPIFIMLSISSFANSYFITMIAMIGTMIGGIGGLNQSQLRPLLAYSSISHLGWIMMGLSMSYSITFIYFMIYVFTTLPIMYMLNTLSKKSNSMLSIMTINPYLLSILMILFMSLGGLPPFLGFFPKWSMIQIMSMNNLILPSLIMLAGSLMNLFYYLNIFFNLYINSTQNFMFSIQTPNYTTNLTAILFTLSLMIFPWIML